MPNKPVVLLVENNHCFGLTATTAAKDIKEQFPKATILYADALFYGKLNNDTKTLSEEEALSKGLETPSTLFPWENEKEEWTTIEARQYEYQDNLSAMKSSVYKAELKG